MSRGFGFGRTAGRRSVRSALSALMAGTLLLALAGGVSAHTPNVTLTCQDGLKVNLAAYNSGGSNTVAVSIDNVAVSGSPFSFGSSYSHTWSVTPPTASHTAKVVVSAWDDPTGSKGWSKTFDRSIEACEDPSPLPSQTPDPTPTPEVTPTPTPDVTPTPQATPTGTVEAETGTPRITPPPTDGLDNSSGGPGVGLPFVLLLLAGSTLALLPTTRRRARNR